MSDAPMVDITRDVDASPATVWNILTTPELFSRWMDGNVTFEDTPGSPFRAEFPNFQTVVAGEVRGIDHTSRRLELTWGVESGPQADTFPAGSSLVTLTVLDAAVGCRVRVEHAQLPDETETSQHEGGWRFHLSRMALFANRHDLEQGLERTLAAWFAAWNDQNDETRLETLRSCCADDIEFRDDWTGHSGVELLNQHIHMCFKFMPGYTLEPTGDVRICRGEALVGWRSSGPAGDQEGFNHMHASHDGTFKRVTGFTAS